MTEPDKTAESIAMVGELLDAMGFEWGRTDKGVWVYGLKVHYYIATLPSGALYTNDSSQAQGVREVTMGTLAGELRAMRAEVVS